MRNISRIKIRHSLFLKKYLFLMVDYLSVLIEEYRKMAEQGRDAWMKHGALEYFECRSEDLNQQDMGPDTSRSFSEMTRAQDGDDVWFSFIVFHSRQHRDEVNEKVFAEMDEVYKDQIDFVSPVEMSRMSYGGFVVMVEGRKA